MVHMKPTNILFRKNKHSQDSTNESSVNTQENQDNTMALVYPDGRVTNVKVRQKESFS